MKSILIFILITFTTAAYSQNVFRAEVKDSLSDDALIGVNAFIDSLNIGASSDEGGKVVINNIPDGIYAIKFSYVGYESITLNISFPEANPSKKLILLKPESVKLGEVFVSSTRTGNRIENTPQRVEVLGLDEVNEEIGIKPGNISKLLGETPGVLVQQTSAASGNTAFRIQGLPSKYTQLLRDGFPIFSGYSSGLSLLQIPPLNLRKVEILKGSSSTLYGGDAIAGIINLLTKEPSAKPVLSFLLNQTQKGESDFSGYYSGRNSKFGLTLLSDYNFQKAADINHNGFTDIPKFQQADFEPKIYYYPDKDQTISEGLSLLYDHRRGGDFLAVNGSPDSLHNYLLENKSVRLISTFKYVNRFPGGNILTFKNSINNFSRKINSLSEVFDGRQLSTYSELSYLISSKVNKFVMGLNFNSDNFTRKGTHPFNMNYSHFTAGLFALDNWELDKNIIWQLGLRTDYNNKYGMFVLPQSFLLLKEGAGFSIRLGGGLGYMIPSIFTYQAEERIFKNVLPISSDVNAERSASASLDLNYKTILFDGLNLDLDQSFFYTGVSHPVMLTDSASLSGNPEYYYYNSDANLIAGGFDTNVHLALDDFEFYFEYAYTDAKQVTPDHSTFLELTPRDKINMTLTLDDEDNWRTGLEAFYTGREYLSGGTKSPDYWTIGAMFQKYFEHFSVIANVENLFDVRQTKFEKIYLPPVSDPTFKQIYAPLDGIVANIAVKIRLL